MKKLYLLLTLGLFIPSMIVAQSIPTGISARGLWDEAKYRQIEQSIRVPQFTDKDYVITKFGAKTDAPAVKNQKAIQKAIDQCSKKGG